MTMTQADRSREQYGLAAAALALISPGSAIEADAATVAAHAAWEAGYWAACHDRSRAGGTRVTANPFDPNNPVAVEDYPQPAPPITPSSSAGSDAPAPADTRP